MNTESQENIKIAAQSIKAKDFNYHLPSEKIAKYPLPKRDRSKILIWMNGEINKSEFKNVADILPKGSFLVFNNTKVVRARLLFFKETGAQIEIFCLEPHEPSDYQLSFASTQTVQWKCIVGNAKKWKAGKLQMQVNIHNQKILFYAEQIQKDKNSYIIQFGWEGGFTFSEIIENAGVIPIPPYLNRESEELDKSRYQTVFAKIKGSVAAPTAGLHFTDDVLEKLHTKKIRTGELTLHVGAGTFRPVKTETIAGHEMHNEAVTVSLGLLKTLKEHKNKVIAVGTTSVRSLESLYWLGIKLKEGLTAEHVFFLEQWEAYKKHPNLSKEEALDQLISWLEANKLTEIHFSTQIIIVPGYDFKIVDGMFTNFHQPQSTLLLLIAAYLGNDWEKVYDFALENDFRFLSYGDSNLYLK